MAKAKKSPPDAQTIVELRVRDILHLEAFSCSPDGAPMVVIKGKNATGKTSVLRSLEMAVGGKGKFPEKPVRRGEEEGEIVLRTQKYTVTRTIHDNGKSELVVQNAAGVPQGSPQTLLSSFIGDLTWDPLEFARADAKGQVQLLKKALGLDFAAEDERRASAYIDRREINRQADNAEKRATGIPKYADVPKKEISVDKLTAELAKAQEINEAETEAQHQVVRARDKIKAARQEIVDYENALAQSKATFVAAEKQLATKQKAAAKLEKVDTQLILDQLSEAGETNKKVRQNIVRSLLVVDASRLRAQSAKLTEEMVVIDMKKAQSIADANLPVKGLTFDKDGVQHNDTPLDQVNEAMRIRISAAIGLALNPTLRVMIIRDGGSLDKDSMAALYDIATANNAQIWVEKVSEDARVKVVITEGYAASKARKKA